jgi:SAM-dependent methyltransferase
MNAKPAVAQELPPPDKLMSLLFGTVDDPLLKLPILRAGIELQVWSAIAAGHRTANAIAASLGADLCGIRCLLDALTMMKLIEKENTFYRLPVWAEYYLLPGKPAYLGDFVLEWLAWEGHGQLSQAIRTGKRPIHPDVTGSGSVGHFLPFYAVRALSPHHYIKRYDGYWQALQVEPRDGMQVLDLACGVGIATHALALQHAGVHVTLQDWPEMLEFALQAARTLGVDQQVTLLPGDMLVMDFEKERFDIARLGYVTYFLGADDLVELFRRVYIALRPGGILVIEASLSDEDRCANEDAIVDGPWLYAITAKGDVYSFLDYKGFLERAGFESVTQVKEDLIKAIRQSC